MDEDCGALKRLYRRYLKRYAPARTAVILGKNAVWRLRQGPRRKPSWHAEEHGGREPRFAVLCDSMTWANFRAETDAVFLAPDSWRQTLERYKPDVFFAEAAWRGLEHEWEGRIYHDRTVYADNRFMLKDILRYCREAGIPSVFWNKEDAPGRMDGPENFTDTALLFDHIFTTAVECIPAYERLGHKSVHLMMFGYSEKLFPPELSRRTPEAPGRAVFLGSWYEDQPERCAEMARVFDWVLSQGMELVIYDRVSAEAKPDRQYPERYRPYIRAGVPYEQTGQIMAQAGYVININSVRDSRTMFARRVFEAMACGRMIVSNESVGLRELFPGRIWYAGGEKPRGDEKIITEENKRAVRERFTFRGQLYAAMRGAGLPAPAPEKERLDQK